MGENCDKNGVRANPSLVDVDDDSALPIVRGWSFAVMFQLWVFDVIRGGPPIATSYSERVSDSLMKIGTNSIGLIDIPNITHLDYYIVLCIVYIVYLV